MDISKRISVIRNDLNITQEAFGEILGVSQRTVAAWESGGRNPSFAKLCVIADKFNSSVDCLLGRRDQPYLYADTQKNPSPEARRRTIAAAADAREGAAPRASNLTEADRRWIEERIRIALGSNPTDSTPHPDD